MDATFQYGYPRVFVAVFAIAVVAALFLALLAFAQRRAPQMATPQVVISLTMMLTFVTVVVFSTLKELPESKTGELLLGALISGWTIVLTFWFGTGSGPPDKPPDKPDQ